MFSPVLNPSKVELYRVKEEAEWDEVRSVLKNPASDFEKVGELIGQPVFFSKEALQVRERIGQLRGLGKVKVRTDDLIYYGIQPNNANWIGYRLKFPEFDDEFYLVSETRPTALMRGFPMYTVVYFERVTSTADIPSEERTRPKGEDFSETFNQDTGFVEDL